jgi:divalent metal cation (Fe/Co/Zn/Cd) transporter
MIVAKAVSKWMTGIQHSALCAIAVAVNIFWSGGSLIRRSFRGLMDLPDPVRGTQLRQAVQSARLVARTSHNRLRFRDTGHHGLVTLHHRFRTTPGNLATVSREGCFTFGSPGGP